mmetsp:Transcript_30065/g.36700  ORF Transcript_30065/g.36700 Transcript_30065/m.36700 type:complete len:81 (+) Transcript_30065:86-328(+)
MRYFIASSFLAGRSAAIIPKNAQGGNKSLTLRLHHHYVPLSASTSSKFPLALGYIITFFEAPPKVLIVFYGQPLLLHLPV